MFKPLLNMSQTDLLLKHFKHRSSITAIEAAAEFCIRSLSRRINDLERNGYRFSRETKYASSGQRYTRYHYLGKAKMPSPASLCGQVASL